MMPPNFFSISYLYTTEVLVSLSTMTIVSLALAFLGISLADKWFTGRFRNFYIALFFGQFLYFYIQRMISVFTLYGGKDDYLYHSRSFISRSLCMGYVMDRQGYR